jgi:nucleoside-diphosphate-sugar epimerase
MKLLVTGANGFIGQALCLEAISRGFSIKSVTRRDFDLPGIEEKLIIKSINSDVDWEGLLSDVDVVIHLAGLAHVDQKTIPNALDEFRKINVDGTLKLAEHAINAGVKRFVFISSIGVNGAKTFKSPFKAQDIEAPHSKYAVSKYEAELGLRAISAKNKMKVVVIRPTMVYGPNAPGNFGTLVRWLNQGWPLPLGAVTKNKRSMISISNLVDLIITCINHPNAANQTFLASDDEDISTAELLNMLGKHIDYPIRLFQVSPIFLGFIANLFGKKVIAQSLLGSLQVDISKTCELLNWRPPLSLDEGLRLAVRKGI